VGLGKTFQIWDPKLFEKFKSIARKKSYLNRSALKWDNKFKKESV
jgi:DNA-binding transcriptional regulator/RsmH inhibitor MraZ